MIRDHSQFKKKNTFMQLHHEVFFNLQRKNKLLEIAAGVYIYIYKFTDKRSVYCFCL